MVHLNDMNLDIHFGIESDSLPGPSMLCYLCYGVTADAAGSIHQDEVRYFISIFVSMHHLCPLLFRGW